MIGIPSVADAWPRIETWLAEHAPVSHQRLNPPASAAAIVEAQRAVGLLFPPDLVELLRLHDGAHDWADGVPRPGAGFLPGGKRLLPARQIVENHRLLSEIVVQSDEKSGDMIGWWWHPSWLPFAADARGDCFYCDERNGADVPLGEFVHDGLAHRAPWTSIAAMLADIADALHTGRDLGAFRPVVTDGALRWDVVYAPPRPR